MRVGRQRAARVDAVGAQPLRPPARRSAMSSSPSAPSSPACGLRPATASRGCGDAEARAQVARDDPAGLDDQVGGQPADGTSLQRQVDGDRHHGELRRPQHHHRHAPARRSCSCGELGEIFGVAGIGEARAVEHVLGDRIGDDRARPRRPARRRRRGGSRRSRPARSMRRGGPARRVTARPRSTTGSAVAEGRRRPPPARRPAIGTPGRCARRGARGSPGSPST